jgi:hypothetical protein
MVNGKLEVCEMRGTMQKYYYDLISIFGNTILAEKKTYLQTSKIVSCREFDNRLKKNM